LISGKVFCFFFSKKESAFSFEKKKQKTFAHWGARWIKRTPQIAKVFASFFKKKRFLA